MRYAEEGTYLKSLLFLFFMQFSLNLCTLENFHNKTFLNSPTSCNFYTTEWLNGTSIIPKTCYLWTCCFLFLSFNIYSHLQRQKISPKWSPTTLSTLRIYDFFIKKNCSYSSFNKYFPFACSYSYFFSSSCYIIFRQTY